MTSAGSFVSVAHTHTSERIPSARNHGRPRCKSRPEESPESMAAPNRAAWGQPTRLPGSRWGRRRKTTINFARDKFAADN